MRQVSGVATVYGVYNFEGETPAAWMMHGLLLYLTGPSSEAAAIRSRFEIICIPCLNPDGVASGNTRCVLFGLL